MDQEIEETDSLKDFINPKSTTGKDFSDYEELDLVMAAELKWCYEAKEPGVRGILKEGLCHLSSRVGIPKESCAGHRAGSDTTTSCLKR